MPCYCDAKLPGHPPTCSMPPICKSDGSIISIPRLVQSLRLAQTCWDRRPLLQWAQVSNWCSGKGGLIHQDIRLMEFIHIRSTHLDTMATSQRNLCCFGCETNVS